ncbi:MAG: hypothetical protein AMXMBFR47_29240 [Planctomycetota bacterium]
MAIQFRNVLRPSDIPVLTEIVRATGRFSAAEVEIAVELLNENLTRGEASDYSVTVAEVDGALAGYTCCGPIPCTISSFDLYWIVVDPRVQGRGVGRALMREFESQVERRGGTHVFIDTSLRGDYAPTRSFYERCGYQLEARLADFYGPGDGKAVFSKRLGGARQTTA